MFITEQYIKPNDCLVAIATPMTKRSANRNAILHPDRDFEKHINWLLYDQDTLAPYRLFRKSANRLKVNCREEFSFSNLRDFFSKGPKVLILFAHWANDAIELFDGFYGAFDFLNVFPEDGRIIFDLNVCTCKEVGEQLGILRPYSIVKHSNENIASYAGAWFLFYSYFFELLASRPLTYIQALNITKNKFIHLFDEN